MITRRPIVGTDEVKTAWPVATSTAEMPDIATRMRSIFHACPSFRWITAPMNKRVIPENWRFNGFSNQSEQIQKEDGVRAQIQGHNDRSMGYLRAINAGDEGCTKRN